MQVFDMVVIGAGPGGYVAAIRAAQLGWKVACIDKNKQLGGTCLRVGCIPSKALLESSELYHEVQSGLDSHGIRVTGASLDLAMLMRRKENIVKTLTMGIDALFKKKGVTRLEGTGSLAGPGKVRVTSSAGEEEISAKVIILATGSKSAGLRGVEVDGDRVVTSTEALSFSEVPNRLAVIGAGYIGLEMASVWNRLGSKVTVLEYLDRIFPGTDSEIAAEAKKQLEKQGMEFRLKSKVVKATTQGAEAVIELADAEPVRADRALLAVGRTPNTEGLGLETVGLALDERGRIPVDDHFQTQAPGIYAIGDVIRGPMLAHKAEEEGIACVERIISGYGHVNYDVIPAVIFVHPEIAAVGKTEDQLVESGTPFNKGIFPFRANGRARALNATEGFVKVLAHKETDRILGVHIIGPRAGDLIAEAAAAMEFGASSEDLFRTCHAHPTLSEALKEAGLAVAGRAIHSL